MQISLAELYVLLDAATGSLAIANGCNLFRFSTEQRERAVNAILKRMNHVPIEVLDTPSQPVNEEMQITELAQ